MQKEIDDAAGLGFEMGAASDLGIEVFGAGSADPRRLAGEQRSQGDAAETDPGIGQKGAA